MVLYDYKCGGCKEIIELSFPMGHAPDTVDPLIDGIHDCAGGILFRTFSPVAVSFKGSGFYSVDSSKKHVNSKLTVGGNNAG